MGGSSLRVLLGTAALVGALVAADANAASFAVQRDPAVPDVIKPADGVSISISANGGSSFMTVGVGLFSLEVAPSPPGSPFTDLLTFCLEVTQVLTWDVSPIIYDVVELDAPGSGIDANQRQRIERLWDRHFAAVVADATAERGEKLAAFQAAIWEIVEDGAGASAPTYDFAGGDFRIDCVTALDVCTYALGFLTIPDDLESGPGTVGLKRLRNDSIQDLIVGPGSGAPDPGDIDVPAPATALLFGAAVAGLGLLRRRR